MTKFILQHALLILGIVAATIHGQPPQTRLSETIKDVTATSVPAYWSAECGDRTYVGSYTLMMNWADCRDYCQYFHHAGELGHTFGFADILDSDTMECLRFNMLEQYTPGNGYAGHYWAGGYKGEDGQFRWDSGAPFVFDDFNGDQNEPYVHLTPGNNYRWDSKTNNDNNNGCLCKSKETVQEKEVKESGCPDGLREIDNRCIRILSVDEYPSPVDNHNVPYNAQEWCLDQGYDGLVEWDSYGEFLKIIFHKHESNIEDEFWFGKDAIKEVYLGIYDSNKDECCPLWYDDGINIPLWRFMSSDKEWEEASDEAYKKYWRERDRHDWTFAEHFGEEMYEDQAMMWGPSTDPRLSLSSVLRATDDINVADYGPAVPMCQKLK